MSKPVNFRQADYEVMLLIKSVDSLFLPKVRLFLKVPECTEMGHLKYDTNRRTEARRVFAEKALKELLSTL